jgi:hypothetical protein
MGTHVRGPKYLGLSLWEQSRPFLTQDFAAETHFHILNSFHFPRDALELSADTPVLQLRKLRLKRGGK